MGQYANHSMKGEIQTSSAPFVEREDTHKGEERTHEMRLWMHVSVVMMREMRKNEAREPLLIIIEFFGVDTHT